MVWFRPRACICRGALPADRRVGRGTGVPGCAGRGCRRSALEQARPFEAQRCRSRHAKRSRSEFHGLERTGFDQLVEIPAAHHPVGRQLVDRDERQRMTPEILDPGRLCRRHRGRNRRHVVGSRSSKCWCIGHADIRVTNFHAGRFVCLRQEGRTRCPVAGAVTVACCGAVPGGTAIELAHVQRSRSGRGESTWRVPDRRRSSALLSIPRST